MDNLKKVNFQIVKLYGEQFKDICSVNKVSISQVLSAFVLLYINDNIDIPNDLFFDLQEKDSKKSVCCRITTDDLKCFRRKCLVENISMSKIINTFCYMVCKNYFVIKKICKDDMEEIEIIKVK